MLITEFYAGQQIFVTGGSGFIGKVLIEKLLRSCPEIGKIFVLLRPKKGRRSEDRLNDLLQSKLFNRLRQEQPKALRKLQLIEGDCQKVGLDISAHDLQKLEDVSIVFHVAATIRFDEPLGKAVLMNVRGTWELIKIAERLNNLRAFVHVSTAYSNPLRTYIEETIYPPLADWRTTIQLAETFDAETLDILALKYSSFQPNTYTFSKSLAEHVVNDYRHKLPVIICRPSIVSWSAEDPMPGWIDSFSGSVAVLIAIGSGVNQVSYTDPNASLDYMPVDASVRAMLLAAYKIGKQDIDTKSPECDVINCCSHPYFIYDSLAIQDMSQRMLPIYPFERTLWEPNVRLTSTYMHYYILYLLLHIPLALLVDTMLRLRGKKPVVMQLQRHIFAIHHIVAHFMLTTFAFKCDNLVLFDETVDPSERASFTCGALLDRFDMLKYMGKGMQGSKVYLFNEKLENLPRARRHFRILQWLNFCLKAILGYIALRIALRYAYRTLNGIYAQM